MTTGNTSLRPALQPPFANYQLDGAYDELFDHDGAPRTQYRPLHQRLLELPAEELRRMQQAADLSFLNQGITFTVYGREEGTERIFPYDLLPRIITSAEWSTLERGLTQRITALNLFLKDLYHEARILAEGVVPREMVYTCKHYRREMRGVKVPRDIYVSVVGTDLIRVGDGRFVVLEDNLRVPSGVSYMLANRQVMKRVFPGLFADYGVRPARILLVHPRRLASVPGHHRCDDDPRRGLALHPAWPVHRAGGGHGDAAGRALPDTQSHARGRELPGMGRAAQVLHGLRGVL
jgi:uncharacterized circularly permuted ATP-grasp superfamily protein